MTLLIIAIVILRRMTHLLPVTVNGDFGISFNFLKFIFKEFYHSSFCFLIFKNLNFFKNFLGQE